MSASPITGLSFTEGVTVRGNEILWEIIRRPSTCSLGIQLNNGLALIDVAKRYVP